MKTRKIILLSLCAVLLCVCIVQGITKINDKPQLLELKTEPDEIQIIELDGTIEMKKEAGEWKIGSKKYPGNESEIQSMIKAVSSIKVLDKVDRATNDSVLARYELNEGERILLTLKKEGKVIKTVTVGKDTSTGLQSYIMIDNDKTVYLVSGSMLDEINKPESKYRSSIVYLLNNEDINSVSIQKDDESYSIGRVGSGDDATYSVSGIEGAVDSAKVKSWFDSLTSLSVNKWFDESESFNGTKIATIQIDLSSKNVKLDIYKSLLTSEDDSDFYYAKCSETSYPFEMTSYSVQKYVKSSSDLQ